MYAALLALAIGLVSGLLSGMFGIGGGIITTPALALLLHAPALVAVGTPLPVILPTAITGAWSYWRRGMSDVRTGVALGLVGAPASILGAELTRRVGGRVVLIGTAVLIGYAAIDMLVGALRPAVPREDGTSGSHVTMPRIVGIGLLAGAYSGFFGLGGGFVLVPAINRLLGFDLKRSIGTSLVAVALLAIPGTIVHYLLGHIDLRLAVGLALGVVPGALLGAHITEGAREANVRIGFAVMLLAVGIILAASQMGVLRA